MPAMSSEAWMYTWIRKETSVVKNVETTVESGYRGHQTSTPCRQSFEMVYRQSVLSPNAKTHRTCHQLTSSSVATSLVLGSSVSSYTK